MTDRPDGAHPPTSAKPASRLGLYVVLAFVVAAILAAGVIFASQRSKTVAADQKGSAQQASHTTPGS